MKVKFSSMDNEYHFIGINKRKYKKGFYKTGLFIWFYFSAIAIFMNK